MRRTWQGVEYSTNSEVSDAEGWAAVRLCASDANGTAVVCRVVFWDAEGQFEVEVGGTAIPLEILEALIAEAKETVPR